MLAARSPSGATTTVLTCAAPSWAQVRGTMGVGDVPNLERAVPQSTDREHTRDSHVGGAVEITRRNGVPD